MRDKKFIERMSRDFKNTIYNNSKYKKIKVRNLLLIIRN